MVQFDSTQSLAAAVIDEITRIIVDRHHPRRLILIGSWARGDARPDSDYDVVIEFDTDPDTAIQLGRQTYRLFTGKPWEINIIYRVTGEIERNADDPGTLDWDIVREGRVLYAAAGVSQALWPSPSRVREDTPQTPPSVSDWIAMAQLDLEAVRWAESAEAWAVLCFHAEQAAEKYLKALLVKHRVRPPRTHRMEDLLAALRAVGETLPDLDEACALLTPYAVEARYGPPRLHDERTGRAALAAAERVVAAVAPLV